MIDRLTEIRFGYTLAEIGLGSGVDTFKELSLSDNLSD